MERVRTILAVMLFVSFAAALLVVPQPAHACSCAAKPDIREELRRKTAIFAGKVTAIEQPGWGLVRSSADPVKVSFEVTEVWKGDVGPRTVVRTALDGASCGFPFEADTDYIVYAYSDENGLATGMCERTAKLSAAAEDLKALGTGSVPPPDQTARSGMRPALWIAAGAAVLAAGWLLWRSVKSGTSRRPS